MIVTSRGVPGADLALTRAHKGSERSSPQPGGAEDLFDPTIRGSKLKTRSFCRSRLPTLRQGDAGSLIAGENPHSTAQDGPSSPSL